MTGRPMAELPADLRLVESARAGSRDSFSRLYRLFAPMVHGILVASVPRVEVDDLVQEVFFQAYRSLPGLRDGAAFGGWLARIARNRAMDFHRSSMQTEALPEELAGPAPRDDEALAALQAIRALPEAYRETLALRLVEGMTGPEIASRTGLTPDSVRVNLHRGMKLLRQKLAGEGAP